jgi:hypothetical protein
MVGRIVIVAYRPRPGCGAALQALAREHFVILKQRSLITDRVPVLMVAQDGTVVEVFEWRSRDAIQSAHTDPAMLALWERYAAICDYLPLAQLPEASDLFAEFTPC